MSFWKWLQNRFGRKVARESRKRICARCEQPIKRNEKWSQKMWDDGRPRHSFACISIPMQVSVEGPTSREAVRIFADELMAEPVEPFKPAGCL